MRRLHLRIYAAVLASLAAFAVVTVIAWRVLGDGGPADHGLAMAAVVARNVLPPPSEPAATQQAALEKLVAGLGADVALFSADRTRLAAVGRPLPAPDERSAHGWQRRWGSAPLAVRLDDGRWVVARLPHRHSAFALVATLALLAIAVGVGAYPIARRLTARLERLQAAVESLGAGELGARVKVEGRDEVARLAESFNRTAERIEALVGAHKSLLANASHELRTPLARIRMAMALMKKRADPALRRDIEQDITELDALIDDVLLASRLDTVKAPEAREDVDLLGLSAEEAARYAATEVSGEAVIVHGDRRLLRRMVRNLLENARRHGAPPVTVRVRRAADHAELRVCDHGPGVPAGEREAVFRPFHRFARSGETAGAGLGLALVAQIAAQHGGQARYAGEEGGASCFVVTLAASAGRAPR